MGKFQNSTDVKAPHSMGRGFHSPHIPTTTEIVSMVIVHIKKYYLKVLNFITNPQRLRQDECEFQARRGYTKRPRLKKTIFFI